MRVEPPPPAPARSRARRWLGVAAVAWALALVGAGYWSARHDPPTTREQRGIEEAAPAVDRAVGELLAAAGADVVPEISRRRLEVGCRLTAARAGATLERAVTLRTGSADGPALLDRIAAGLPASYEASAGHGASTHRLRADAGDFVAVSGGVVAAGVVTLTARSGCRPQSPDFAAEADLLPGRAVDDVALRVLTALGAASAEQGPGTAVPCPGGGAAMTGVAHGPGAAPDVATLRRAAGAGAVVVHDKPPTYAYRAGPDSVVVRHEGGMLTVTATLPC